MKILMLVEKFEENVLKQNSCIRDSNPTEGNKAAKKYIKAFKDLIDQFGDEGRDKLAELLKNPDEGVRAMAAAFLMRYKTLESKKVLSEIAAGKGFVAFGAGETLKRWQEGTWALDLPEKNEP